MREQLEVTMLGGFQLASNGEVAPPIPSRQARSLLAYLLLNRDRRHRREHLIGLFWPDMPDVRARRRLSHVLWQLQEVMTSLHPHRDLFDATPDHIGIDPDAAVHIDVEQFERGVQRHRPDRPGEMVDLHGLHATVDVYQGELMVGHDDDWLLPERERLHQVHLDALGWLVSASKGQGAHDEALAYARRLTVHDPLREDAHREVMRLFTLLGRTSDALRQYEACKSVLLEELGADPSAETQQLAGFITRQRTQDHPPATVDTNVDLNEVRMVGRDDHRLVLVAAMKRVLAGEAATVMVDGEPGLGLTRLLQQCREDARWRDLEVLAVRRSGAATMRPYQAVVDALTPHLTPIRVAQLRNEIDDVWRSEAARLLPQLGDVATHRLHGAAGRERLLEALVRVVVSLLGSTPAVIIADDLHLLDAESLEVLEVSARRLMPVGIGVILGVRMSEVRAREDVWDAVEAIDSLAVPDRITLQPLRAGDTMKLVGELLPGVVPLAFSKRVHDETGGNPLFVIETIRAVRAQGHDTLEDLAALPLPSTIRELISDALARYDTAQQRVLLAAAVMGRPLTVDSLTAALGPDSSDVGPALPRLVRDGILKANGSDLSFAHDQVRRVTVEVVPDDGVRLRVAQLLHDDQPERMGEAADLFEQAGDLPKAATANADAAARARQVHAYREAAQRLRRALDLQSTTLHDPAARRPLLWELEEVLAVLGEVDEQRAVLVEVQTSSLGTDEETRAWQRAAAFAATTDDLERACKLAERAFDAAADDRARGRALVTLGSAQLWQGNVTQAIASLARSDTLLTGTARGQALATLGDAKRRDDDLDGAVVAFEQAIAIANDAGDIELQVRALTNLAGARIAGRDMDGAHEVLCRALELARSVGYLRAQALALGNLGYVEQTRGAATAAQDCFEEAVSIASSINEARLVASVQMNHASLLHHVLGQHDRAGVLATDAAQWFARSGDPDSFALCQETLASISLAAGRLDEARDRLSGIDPDGLNAMTVDQLIPTVVESALSGGTYTNEAMGRWVAERGSTRLAAGWMALWAASVGDRTSAAAAQERFRSRAPADDALERVREAHVAWRLALASGGDGLAEIATAGPALDLLHTQTEPAAIDAVLSRRDVAALLDADRGTLPARRTASLAAIGVPTGRELTADELRQVEFRVAPHTSAAGRRQALLDVIDQARAAGADPTVGDLADLLDVSVSTLNRDLRDLRRQGTTIDTRGSRSA